MDGMVAKQSRKEVEWRQRLARFATSSQQVKQFCQAESVSEATFYRWRKQLVESDDAAPTARFIDVGAMPPPSVAQSLMPCALTGTGAALEVRLDLGHGLVLQIVRR